jgi:hypothetical protein
MHNLLSLPKELISIMVTEMDIFDVIMFRTACKFLYNLVKASDRFPRHYVLDQQKCLEYYATLGNISALEYLKSMNFIFTAPVCERAAETGRLDVLKYLRTNGCFWSRMTPICAARNGHLDVLQYVLENETKSFDTQTINTCYVEATTKGYLPVIKYLHERGYEWETQTVTLASYHRHFEVFKYAIENGALYTPEFTHFGDLEFMQYAEERNLERWKTDACMRAAMNGNLDAMKFAHERGSPLNFSSGLCAASLAAAYGHLDCLKYSIEHGERADGIDSVKNVEVLKYLNEETDIPLLDQIYVQALQDHHQDIVEYMLEHTNIPPPKSLARYAAHTGDVKFLEWAIEKGFDASPREAQYDNNTDVYAASITAGSLDCLKLAAEKNLPMGRDPEWYFSRIFDVRPPSFVAMVKWWMETLPYVISESTLARAVQHGSVELLDLLVEKGADFSEDHISHVNNVRNLAYMFKLTSMCYFTSQFFTY